MKTTNLMRFALYVAIMAAFSLVGCEDLDQYSIDAPSDLQSTIDSIADARASMNTGDTTHLTINTALVGAEDYTSGWWTAFSDYFAVPTNKLLHLEFINNNGGSGNNWNNWTLIVTNEVADRDDAAYSEYFALRSDAYGWGNGDFDLGVIANNYPDTDGDEDIWNDFRATMDGAYISMDIDHSSTGYVFITAKAVGTNGTELELTYNQPVSASADITAFLVADASYFQLKKAYLLPSKVTVIEDVLPSSLSITGTPQLVEIGSEDFWGNGVATVTFADGSSAEVDTTDVTFTVVPDLTTVGEKTVLASYSKTKQGEYTDAVSAFYTLEVVNAVTSLAVTTLPTNTTYTFPGPVAPKFDPTDMVVTATYSDGTTGVIPNENLVFLNPGGDGVQDAIISYVGAVSTVSTTTPVTNTMGAANQVGASDFSSGFWSAFSNEYPVFTEGSKKFTMTCGSSGGANWNAPVVVLRKADLTEYAVVRMDNYGWGNSYADAVTTHDWNFDEIAANINGSSIVITVTNVGDGTASVRYDVTYANGEVHFQEYTNIPVDAGNLNTAITIDGCYVNITSVE